MATATRTARAATPGAKARSGESKKGSSSRRARSATRRGGQKTIFGVPERFMKPRLVLIVCVGILVCFGALMIYSASSITCMQGSLYNYDAAYLAKKQLQYAAIGAVIAVFLANVDYHWWSRRLLPAIWVATVALLVAVLLLGTSNYGSTRSVFGIQPSEFAKVTVVLTAANLAQRRYEEHSISDTAFWVLLVAGVGVPLALILLEPDRGTTIILCITLLVMGYLGGLPRKILLGILVIGGAAMLVNVLTGGYSLSRVLTMLDPWNDPYGDGYQLIQGFYAFGSGGLFGVGIGMSKQKYSYLPMAYNDFILAVIGEECGLVGTLLVVAAFLVIVWAGFQIARYAPDLEGSLVAAGSTSLLMIQMLVNVGGVLGLLPLTGKPIPFLSYGGSSILSSLILVGITVSVSVRSRLPETVHDEKRRSLRVEGQPKASSGFAFVGEATPRSARGAATLGNARTASTADEVAARAGSREAPQGASGAGTESGGFRVVSGGRQGSASEGRASSRGSGSKDAPKARVTTDANGRQRIDLGPSAADRLRGGSSHDNDE